MNFLNNVIIEGRLTRDPETKDAGNRTVSNFTIACNRYFKRANSSEYEQETSFFDVQAWGKLAETSAQNGVKGRLCRVSGRLKQERWDTDSGQKTRVLVIASQLEYAPEKAENKETKAVPSFDEIDEVAF